MVFAHGDHQGVEFVVERQTKLLRVVGKGVVHQSLHVAIFLIAAGKAVAVSNTAQIFIHNRNRMKKRVEQNGVGGFLAHPGQVQQLAAYHAGWLGREPGQGRTVVAIEKGDERLDGGSLAYHVSRRTDECTQLVLPESPESWRFITPCSDRLAMERSTPRQDVFWVRYAPTITSSGVCAGHHCWGPYAAPAGRENCAESAQLLWSWRWLLFLQVLFPSQQLGLQCLGLCLGDHALVLIQDGKAGVRQHLLWIELKQAPRHRDRPVEVTLLL